MAIVDEQDNFGKRIAEVLGLSAGMVVGIDIRVEPGNFVTATAKIFLKENQVKGLGVIFDEMKFVGIKKTPESAAPVFMPPSPVPPTGPVTSPVYWPCETRKWFSWLPVVLLLVAGCRPASPPPPDLRPWIAVTGVYALMAPAIAPLPPAPAPGAPCENCNGKGTVGDGVVGKTCPICGGTGVTPSKAPAAPLPPVPTAGVSVDPPARSAAPGASGSLTRGLPVSTEEAPTFRIVCEDGVCRKIRVLPR
jgi:hypothetical protein